MNRRTLILIGLAVAAVGLAAAGVYFWLRPSPRATAPMTQEAYVWQRAYSPAVRDALAKPDELLTRLVALGAEITFDRSAQVAHVDIDYDALKASGVPIGLALRIGAYRGSFAATAEATKTVLATAAGLLQSAQDAGVAVKELQVDFDCPTSKLGEYSHWVAAIKGRVAPTPVVITALPSWLESGSVEKLLDAADGYVLQVHSLERPAAADVPLTLIDPAAARVAVELAGRLGRPFRLALPTYGYLVAFDSSGQFIGLSAEGPAPNWPADVDVRPVRSNPGEMAELVRSLAANRPAGMEGIIWYRLPTGDDALNWRPVTLAMVMRGQSPRQELSGRTRQTGTGLYEIDLVNSGQAAAAMKVAVTVRWKDIRLVSSDALAGFDRAQAAPGEVRFVSLPETAILDLPPGQTKAVGWIRLAEDADVQVDVARE